MKVFLCLPLQKWLQESLEWWLARTTTMMVSCIEPKKLISYHAS